VRSKHTNICHFDLGNACLAYQEAYASYPTLVAVEVGLNVVLIALGGPCRKTL
jgi:hypothetical protein